MARPRRGRLHAADPHTSPRERRMADQAGAGMAGTEAGDVPLSRPEARRKLVLDGLGIIVSAVGFGFVYGLAARTDAGFSPIDVMAMSVFAFAGAAQFAAVGYVASGVPWFVIGVLTGLLNARHVLYSAALAPWFRGRGLRGAGRGGPRPDRRGVRPVDRPLPAAGPVRRVRLLVCRDRRHVHPVVPRDARRGAPRRGHRRPGAPRHRRDLPGGDDRPRGRADHRAGASSSPRSSVRRSASACRSP